jgi:hypothetical protein
MTTRHRDVDWSLPTTADYPAATLAVLMDLRDRLDRLLAVVECRNFTNIPTTLRSIARNTARYRCRACPRTFESRRGADQHVRRAHT